MISTKTMTAQKYSNQSDEDLVKQFVDAFIQGQFTLLSTPTLRTEPLFESMQLTSRKEGLIATANLNAAPMYMVVRQQTTLWPYLHDALLTQQLYPVAKAGQDGCFRYQHCVPPEGYELHCTTAKELWRIAWGRGFGLRAGIPLDLLVWHPGAAGAKASWQSLRGMDCDQGQLLIKVLGSTTRVFGTDLVVWARQIDQGRLGSQQSRRSRPTYGHSYLPLNR